MAKPLSRSCELILCFREIAVEANRYVVKNGNDPNIGNLTEEKRSELEDFIECVETVIGALGYKVFVPLVDDNTTSDEEKLFCTHRGANAVGVRTANGFVVKKGSTIAGELKKSCREYTTKLRERYKDKIDKNYRLLEDILFDTPSGAASFVCGASENGNTDWKTADGKTLKELDAQGQSRTDFQK